ncbi:hypothetical protein D7V93_27255 [Corallococcus llansteffanensis]|uniref:Uncharacterized protein n=1 Tax=Corallococcus llansteffanensis TaxID=2316731 RepID=A0A3A8P9C2_9BACT|nr:hypothetical protein D7V93_27255 [Corallococcus llansteffanensis]
MLPEAGGQSLPGATALAIQLVMDDVLPRERTPAGSASPQEVCLFQRQSYDIEAAPGPEGVVWVRVSLSPGACTRGGPLPNDAGSFSYAVDVKQRRILAARWP